MAFGFFVAAFLLFVIGSIAIAHGSAVITRELGLSPLAVGLIVMGTTAALPVLFVLWRAKTLGVPDLGIGGVVGGAIFAVTLPLGLCAQIRPLECQPKVMGRDTGMLAAAAACFLLLSLFEVSSRLAGLLLLSIFAVYMTLTYTADRRRAPEHSIACAHAKALEVGNWGLSGGVFEAAIGAIAILLGAHLAVTGGIGLAWLLNVPQYVVGLSAVAACMSLPAFLVVFVGAQHGRSTILTGYGVFIGIVDLTCALGLSMLLSPVKIANVFVADGAAAALLCLLLPVVAAGRWRLSRTGGIVLIAAYGLYLGILTIRLNLLSLFSSIFW